MSKQLIVDYLPFEVTREQINESLKENNGRLVVHGVLQRSDAKNQNGRVYPHEILTRESNKYAENFVTQKRAMGELDHPESSVVNLQNVSHNVTEMHWEGKNLIGSVEVLGTPSGNILGELFKAGIKLGISSRGLGSVEPMQEGDGQTVQNDFELNDGSKLFQDSICQVSFSLEITINRIVEYPHDLIWGFCYR